MPEPVIYELQLKDSLSPKVEEAEGHARKLESTMGEIGEKAKRMGEAFGIAFASFEIYDFVRDSNEGFEKLEQSNAQLKSGLVSTGMAAGMSFADLQQSQDNFREKVDYSKSAIADLQAQLLTFPSITKTTFDKATSAILDMATRTHHGLDEVSIMVGKALSEPERGMNSLRRVGVNFTKGQEEMIKKMMATGHAAQAQGIILKELTTEFGGSAAAAAEANPFFEYDKAIESLQLDIGGVINQFKVEFAPTLTAIANDFKSTIEWMKQHKDLMRSIGEAVGIAVGAYVGYITINKGVQTITALTTWYTNLQKAATIALGVESEAAGGKVGFFTVMQEGLNAAMRANPLGVIITALTIVTEAVIYCWNHFATFRAGLMSAWETAREFGKIVGDIFTGLWHTIHGVFSFDASEIKLGTQEQVNAIFDASKRLGNAAKNGWNDGLKSFADDQKTQNVGLVPTVDTKNTKALGQTQTVTPPTDTKTKATGSKNISITVNIKELVHNIEIKTTTLMQSTAQLRDEITKALTSAVMDSQLIAGD